MGRILKQDTRLALLAQAVAVLLAMLVSGCASSNGHDLAFSDKTALVGNSRQLDLSSSQAMRATKQVLVRQGFTIESVDTAAGLIKSVRNLQDPEEPEQSYNISATAYVFESGPQAATLTLSASEQTILHRKWRTWWHLLWILPIIPTGTEYQTVVTKEGNVTDPGFYRDFFTSVNSVGTDIKAGDRAAELKAAAEKAAAEKAAAEKAAAEKAAAEKAATERAAAEKAAAEKAAAEKAAAEKAAAEKAAAEKAAAEKAATERAAAEKAAAEKAAAEKAATEVAAAAKAVADSNSAATVAAQK